MSEQFLWHSSSFEEPDPALLSESLPAALARAVESWPKNPAVLIGRESFSFEDLARRAAGLAEEILRSSTSQGPVALLQSPGLDAIASWFACGLARRPFLLLEPSYPPSRLKELIEASSATLAICDAVTVPSLPSELHIKRLLPDGRRLHWYSDDSFGADEPAMIFPTSGSTGTPKLVTYSSRTLQVKVQSSRQLMGIPPGARVLIAGSHGNYGFLHHALVFLFSGGTLYLSDIRSGGFSGLLQAITQFGVKHVRFTPSLFRAIARQPEARDALRNLEAVRFSGEPLLRSDLEWAKDLLAPTCLIQNIYGSTESSLFIWREGNLLDPLVGTVPIGHVYPHSSYAIRPLDEGPCDHETGELILRSPFHALGDLYAGTINQDRFPLEKGSRSERIYATGDIVRRLPDGGLVMLGRISRMVKIRGQRVFLSEVENHLRALPGAKAAAVVERTEEDATAIYGFITAEEGMDRSVDARAWLTDRLPDFMLPRQVLLIDEIPMLPGGKVDNRALLQLLPEFIYNRTPQRLPEGDYGRLTGIWHSILGAGADEPENDFFSLGGDSLKLLQLTLAVEREFGRSISAEAFLGDPTLAGLAKALGVGAPQETRARKQGLRLRLFRKALQPSLGVAIVMPGWHGSAPAAPFCQAGFFADHDTWTADVSLDSGSLLEKRRWWQAAVDIANRLIEAVMPAPRILFGSSIGGSIAWLVGCLLAETAKRPEFVVMVDAVPIHRSPAYTNSSVRTRVDKVTAEYLPASLHIRRPDLQHATNAKTANWQAGDNIFSTFELPTVDHLETMQVGVLRHAQPWVTLILKIYPDCRLADQQAPQLLTTGGQIYRLLTSGNAAGDPALDRLSAQISDRMSHDCLMALVYLIIRDGTPDQATQAVKRALSTRPGSRLLEYLLRRLDRTPGRLCPDRSSNETLATLAGIENLLAGKYDVCTKSNPINRILQAFDLLSAVTAASPARASKSIRRWIKS